MIRAALALVPGLAPGLTAPAAAQPDPAFPAPDCAALWTATARFRARHAIDPAPPEPAAAMAAAFRAAAVQMGADPGTLDARIAALVPVYLVLLQRSILDGDRAAQDQYEWLSGLCRDLAQARGLAGH
ncbi:hypothetical protein [Rhodovulum marinum]|uniref:Uncharacterized protein n=1 Tax=Rhodovulum marinum TaxID=320662 RepID=A0A4R2Q5L7_9RHOB|nr:hypothetical protein [Rhodovulum marinum]TCP43108.1 hypothetical protein EV662_102301 [Rhodovulum marinum]